MAETTTVTPTSSIEPGKYTKDKLFLKLDTTEFNSHKSDINANGQIAFVDNGDSSYIYAQGIKVGGTDINVDDLNLSDYATKSHVTNAINALDVNDAAVAGKYVSAVSEANGKITVNRADLPTLSSLGGITSSSVDTKISNAINALDVNDTAVAGKYVSAVSEANGKITVTRASLPTVQTVSVSDSKNSVTIDGTKYTLSISDGVLSLSPYKSTSITSYSLSTISANKTQTGGGNFYVGTTANVSYGIDITSTSQTLTIHIDNPTSNKCKLAVSDGSASYLRQDTSYASLNGDITVSIGSAYIMKDVATNTYSSIPITWAAAKQYSANTTGERTFKIYLTEQNKSTITKSITQANINASVTIAAKVPALYSTDNFSTKTLIKDIVYGSIPSTLDFGAGISKKVTYIAIPKAINKTISKIVTGIGNLAFTKQSTTKTISHGGSSLEYDIYKTNAEITLESNATIHLA